MLLFAPIDPQSEYQNEMNSLSKKENRGKYKKKKKKRHHPCTYIQNTHYLQLYGKLVGFLVRIIPR